MKIEHNSPLDVLLGTITILCAAASWVHWAGAAGEMDRDDTGCGFIIILKGT